MMRILIRSVRLLLPLLFVMTLTAANAGYEEESWVFNRQGMLKVSQGNLSAAIRDFEKACRLNPFNDTALANLACAHNNLAVLLARQKKFDEAIRHFTTAKAQKPEDISIRLNLLSLLVSLKNASAVEKEAGELTNLRPNDVEIGLKIAAALQKTENTSNAILMLQDLSSRVGDHAELHATLGRMLYQSGQLDESAYHLRRSHELNPGDLRVTELIERLKRENTTRETTTTYTGLHFNLTCPDSFSTQWAEKTLDLLEEAYDLVGQQLDFYPHQRSQVLILPTEDFRKVHDLPEWAGGVYDGKIRLPVPARNPRHAAIRGAIMHEYTHHVVHLITAGNCPIWLNEGLAQLFENNHENASQLATIPTENFTALTEIDKRFRQKPDRPTAAILYRTSLTAVARLVEEHNWSRIAAFLEYLGMGYETGAAAREAFAVDFNELEKACLQSEESTGILGE